MTRSDEPTLGADQPHPYKYKFKYMYQYAHPGSPEQPDPEAAQAQAASPAASGDEHGDASPHGNSQARDGEQAPDEDQGASADDKSGGQDGNGKDDDDKESKEDERRRKRKRNIVLIVIACVFVLAGIGWLLYDQLVLQYEATTDDAYIQGDQVQISSRVNGTVVQVNAENTDLVHAGQALVKLDPVDTQVSLMNARGKLAQAVRQARQMQAQAAEADAAIAQRQAAYERARAEYRRRLPLLKANAASKEHVDSARRQMQQAKAAYDQAREQAKAAHASVDGTTISDFPAVQQARANFIHAWVDARHNAIISPVDGYVAQRHVQPGQHIQAGQALMVVVPLHNLWIDANLKETDIAGVRIGQPVTITTDAYDDVTFHGKVVGLAAGTGSAFSLLPPENASGNWIKVVQRLPVRISLEPKELDKHPLRVGLSAYININTHDRDGQVLASAPRRTPLMTTAVYNREMRDAQKAADAVIAANAHAGTSS
ncbi:HlyD family efflux transporter periplasmic adaptor subunit [Oleiagrimonas sp. C23AA]|uniref:efflux RND transporter periplasmic adaptor subunit n=1 Tax=Oleiagrimonas sp. C23AA TaxID=2719047 RepID=UPI00141E49B0|nr:HlyD family efflux transporter periplasmic adaptor subunit [Oleiagrimonas sp. C23AA]NII11692.1 HlyD family efflux transporter periplasmic adaptor subunit [Oleiagrimonas sp. C23AA]